MGKVHNLSSHPARMRARQEALEQPMITDVPAYRAGILGDGTVAIDWLFPSGYAPIRMSVPEAQRLIADMQALVHLARERRSELDGKHVPRVEEHPLRGGAIVVVLGEDRADFVSFKVDDEDAIYAICSLCDCDIPAGDLAWHSEPKVDERGRFAERLLPNVLLCDPCATPRPAGLELVDLTEKR